MNYKKHYDALMSKAQNRNLPEDTYTERHHIKPRSLGGSNDDSNLVDLTAKEHYVAHHLLYRMAKTKKEKDKMGCAWFMLTHIPQKPKRVTSYEYEKAKKAMSEGKKGKDPWNKGLTGVGTFGVPRPEEVKKKISESKKGTIPWHAGKKIGPYPEERKAKLREIVTCPHCGKEGGKGGMVRHHFNNCNHKHEMA